MLDFLGVAPDRRLLDEELSVLPAAEQRHERAIASPEHGRLVAAGSLMTGATLIAGGVLTLFGGWEALFNSGGALAAVVAVMGILLLGTHWGWVHVAEYVGITIDERHGRAFDERGREWLAGIQPYPRFSVSTTVLDDASTRIERVLHRPVPTDRDTFTFVREIDSSKIYDADSPAEEIAEAVETMRRDARLQTDRLRELWEAASSAYEDVLLRSEDDRQRLAAQRAAATALSEHLNAKQLEPPLVE
jgi:hypothetical protein